MSTIEGGLRDEAAARGRFVSGMFALGLVLLALAAVAAVWPRDADPGTVLPVGGQGRTVLGAGDYQLGVEVPLEEHTDLELDALGVVAVPGSQGGTASFDRQGVERVALSPASDLDPLASVRVTGVVELQWNATTGADLVVWSAGESDATPPLGLWALVGLGCALLASSIAAWVNPSRSRPTPTGSSVSRARVGA